MPRNSRKCKPLSHSQKNCRIRSTTSPQMCCRPTLRNLNVHLCNFTARYSKQMWPTIVYVQYLSIRNTKLCFICLRRLICSVKCVKIVYIQHTRMIWCMHANGQWLRQWRIVKCRSAKCLVGSFAMYFQLLNDVSNTKKHNKLKICLLNRNTS